MVMMTLEGLQAPPSIEQVAERLQVPESAIDAAFGVILIDPQRKLYTVRVRSDALKGHKAPGVEGPFSDPKIAPFGPPEPEK